MKVLKLFSVLFISLLIAGCDFSSPDNPAQDKITLTVNDVSEVIKTELNNKGGIPFYENNYYYRSSASAVVVISAQNTKDNSPLDFSLISSDGTVYKQPFKSAESKTLATQNGSTLTLYLSNFDTLSTYTLTATNGKASASYSFNILSADGADLDSSLAINYTSLSIDSEGNITPTSATTTPALISSSSPVNIVSGMAYNIAIEPSLSDNPFGRIKWSIENTDNSCFFIRGNTSSKEITTSSDERGVYIVMSTPNETANITVSCGDIESKTFSIIASGQRQTDSSLDNMYSVSFTPVIGGMRVSFSLSDASLYNTYCVSYALNNSLSDWNTLCFEEDGTAHFEHLLSSIPGSDESITVPISVKLISGFGSTNPSESSVKDYSFTIKRIPVTASIEYVRLATPSSELIPSTNTIRPDIPIDTLTSWAKYTTQPAAKLVITPLDLTPLIDRNLLTDAMFIVERNSEVIYTHPYFENNVQFISPVEFALLSEEDGGVYQAYIKDIKGYADETSQAVSYSDISIQNIKGVVTFFQERNAENNKAIYKVNVSDTNIPHSDYSLYLQYSEDAGTSWSKIFKYPGSVVYTADKDDINSGITLTDDTGNVYPFEQNSKNVLFRSLIIADTESTLSIKKPTTGITSENNESLTTATLSRVSPANIEYNDASQQYFNARQITITRNNSSTDCFYYFEKGGDTPPDSTIYPDKCINPVIWGKVAEITATGTVKIIGTHSSNNVAVLLVGKTAVNNGVIAMGNNNVVIKTTDDSGKAPSYSVVSCTFKQCEAPNIRAVHRDGACWAGCASHDVYLNYYVGQYTQITFCARSGDHDDADPNGTRWNLENGELKPNMENRLSSNAWAWHQNWGTGYYSHRGYLDSNISTHKSCGNIYATWNNYPHSTNYQIIRTK